MLLFPLFLNGYIDWDVCKRRRWLCFEHQTIVCTQFIRIFIGILLNIHYFDFCHCCCDTHCAAHDIRVCNERALFFCCFSIIIYLQILCVCSRNLLLSRIKWRTLFVYCWLFVSHAYFSKCFDLATFCSVRAHVCNDMSSVFAFERLNEKGRDTKFSYKISSSFVLFFAGSFFISLFVFVFVLWHRFHSNLYFHFIEISSVTIWTCISALKLFEWQGSIETQSYLASFSYCVHKSLYVRRERESHKNPIGLSWVGSSSVHSFSRSKATIFFSHWRRRHRHHHCFFC